MYKWVLGLMLSAFTGMAAFAAQEEGVGEVASNLMDPVNVMSDFVTSACLVLGGAFLFATIVKYREHRRSPTMVPLSTVIFLLIAGIVLVSLPLITYVASN